MVLLSYDVEDQNIDTYSTIDKENILNKIKELRNKLVGYPPLLIYLLKKELDRVNYKLKIKLINYSFILKLFHHLFRSCKKFKST